MFDKHTSFWKITKQARKTIEKAEKFLNKTNSTKLASINRAKSLPSNEIYFFYEEGEIIDHRYGLKPRIVRIGTHKENNFQSRISEHFLLKESKMNFTIANPKPSDRSIFRKNIGRALLNKNNGYYLKILNIDYMFKENCLKMNLMRNIEKEKQIESEISKILRDTFSLRFIALEGQQKRIGKEELECRLIGTVANCNTYS